MMLHSVKVKLLKHSPRGSIVRGVREFYASSYAPHLYTPCYLCPTPTFHSAPDTSAADWGAKVSATAPEQRVCDLQSGA